MENFKRQYLVQSFNRNFNKHIRNHNRERAIIVDKNKIEGIRNLNIEITITKENKEEVKIQKIKIEQIKREEQILYKRNKLTR